MGAAFGRIAARLDGRQHGSGTFMAHCPNHGHHSPGTDRSVKITDTGEGHVLLHCFGGCHPEDVLAAVGLTMADLYDKPLPPKRPKFGRNQAEQAVSAETSLPMAETLAMLTLLRRANNDTLQLPAKATPRVPTLAREIRLSERQTQRVLRHLEQHRWLKVAPGSGRTKSSYALLPDGKPGEPCGCAEGRHP